MTAPESTRFRMMIIIALMMAEFTSAFELTMIYTALKTFFVMFGDPQAVGWVVTSYLLVSAAAAAICGKLGDMFGRKRVLMIVLVGAMTGSLISASTSDLNFIIAGRAIQGLAGAILPLCFGIAREALPLNKVPYGVSAIGSTAVVSAGLGVLLGGIIVDRLEWFAIFYVSSAFAFISFCAVLIFVPNTKVTKTDSRIDVLGGLLFVPAIFGVLLAVSKGGSWGWASPITLSLLIGGICLLGIWVWHELRIDHPLINLRLLTNPQL
ncbi:MAG: MFS transporter, partial [Sphingobium sp.]